MTVHSSRAGVPGWDPGDSLQELELAVGGDAALELTEIYRRAPVGLARLDRGLRFLRANDFFALMVGCQGVDLVGRLAEEALVGDQARSLVPLMRQVLTRGERSTVIGRGGRRRWISDCYPMPDGSGVGLIVRDLTVISVAEEVVRQQGEFERLIAGVSGRFVRYGAEELQNAIVESLQSATALLGTTRGVLLRLRRDAAEWVEVDACGGHRIRRTRLERVRKLAWFWRMMEAGEPLEVRCAVEDVPAEARTERRLLERAEVESFVAVPLLSGQDLIGVIGFASAETRHWGVDEQERVRLLGSIFGGALLRRQAEETARLQREELSHLMRVTTLNQLTASLAHEIRQPLAAIAANAAAARLLLGAEETPRGEVGETIGMIESDARRAAAVVARARELLRRRGEGAFAPVDINELVTRVVRLVKAEASARGASINVVLGEDVPAVDGDRIQLEQVLLNLLMNAMDAVEPTSSPRVIDVTTAIRAECVVVSVGDSGVGIAPELMPMLFQPFFTTKTGGAGLGLSISRSILEAHAGTLEAASDGHRGTIFSFTLPIARSPSHGPDRLRRR